MPIYIHVNATVYTQIHTCIRHTDACMHSPIYIQTRIHTYVNTHTYRPMYTFTHAGKEKSVISAYIPPYQHT